MVVLMYERLYRVYNSSGENQVLCDVSWDLLLLLQFIKGYSSLSCVHDTGKKVD